jgi:outer membrane protein assembly factor BamD (BamD/ComL family)
MLADLSYDSKDFISAGHFYDSVSTGYITDATEKNRLQLRRDALKIIVRGLSEMHTEDSLQAIAAMPKAAQEAVIKKMLRQLRKQQGLKEDDGSQLNINAAVRGGQPAATDLFAASPAAGTGSSSGEWYFNNNALKAQGYNSFRQQWGNRPNVDNWRRQAAVNKALASNALKTQAKEDSTAAAKAGDANNALSYEALYAKLPTTQEKLDASNSKIEKALFTNAQAFQDKLMDYEPAVDSYDTLNRKYAGNSYEEEALFNLYYCYMQLGKTVQADSVKRLLSARFATGKFNNLLQKGLSSTPGKPDPATEKYQQVYNLFIEGRFEDAEKAKASADSMYGKNHWTPQLLFIEAVYHVSRREDSAAINRLNSLTKLYPSSPMAERATTMISVLQRRSQIESYLTQLQITRYKEDEVVPVVITKPGEMVTVTRPLAKPDSVAKPVIAPVFMKRDSVKAANIIVKKFEFVASDSQYVSILLDKVAPVFAGEAGNAFNRYNMSNFYNLRLKTNSVKLDDRYYIVLIGPFKDAAAAIDYVNRIRPVAGSRIVPWLTSDKYGFSIISNANLNLLRENKDVEGYRQLLQSALPGQF